MRRLRKASVLFVVLILFAGSSSNSLAGLAIPLFGWHLVQAKQHVNSPVVAIIIDDIGYAYTPGAQSIDLPANITLSVIPYTPYGKQLANVAYLAGKEVMLHAPMETINQSIWEPSLDTAMEQHEILAGLGAMLNNVPHVRGINNHGGSLFTQDKVRMAWVMDVLLESGLYFVDSRTTSASVGYLSAQHAGVQSAERDIFLDNDRSPDAIARQFYKLQRIANTHGRALAIGHPYNETIRALRDFIPLMQMSGIRIVFVSEYLSLVEWGR